MAQLVAALEESPRGLYFFPQHPERRYQPVHPDESEQDTVLEELLKRGVDLAPYARLPEQAQGSRRSERLASGAADYDSTAEDDGAADDDRTAGSVASTELETEVRHADACPAEDDRSESTNPDGVMGPEHVTEAEVFRQRAEHDDDDTAEDDRSGAAQGGGALQLRRDYPAAKTRYPQPVGTPASASTAAPLSKSVLAWATEVPLLTDSPEPRSGTDSPEPLPKYAGGAAHDDDDDRTEAGSPEPRSVSGSSDEDSTAEVDSNGNGWSGDGRRIIGFAKDFYDAGSPVLGTGPCEVPLGADAPDAGDACSELSGGPVPTIEESTDQREAGTELAGAPAGELETDQREAGACSVASTELETDAHYANACSAPARGKRQAPVEEPMPSLLRVLGNEADWVELQRSARELAEIKAKAARVDAEISATKQKTKELGRIYERLEELKKRTQDLGERAAAVKNNFKRLHNDIAEDEREERPPA